MKKSIKLYNLIDEDGEVLRVAQTMKEIKEDFINNFYPMDWEDDLTEEMIKELRESDEVFLKILNESSWQAEVELIRTITSDDLE